MLEYRVQEARDKSDLTETGVCNALLNCEVGNVYNEDIYDINYRRIAMDCIDNPYTMMLVSPQCDDLTTLKTNAAKEKSVEKLDSTIDMFIPILNLCKAMAPPVLVMENAVCSIIYCIVCIFKALIGYFLYTITLCFHFRIRLVSRSKPDSRNRWHVVGWNLGLVLWYFTYDLNVYWDWRGLFLVRLKRLHSNLQKGQWVAVYNYGSKVPRTRSNKTESGFMAV